MANRNFQPVSYRPFRADPLLPDGLLGVAREGGELERRVADAMFRVAAEQGVIADRQAAREGERAGEQAALAAMPRTTVEPGTGAAGPAPAARTPAQAATVKAYLMDRHGFSEHRAAAITGHLIQESNLRPSGAVGDAGTAFGIAQWRGARFSGLREFARKTNRPWQQLETQLDYVVHELGTSESYAGQALANSTTLEEATAAFMHFERPSGYTRANPQGGHAFAQRLANARGLLGGGGTAPAGAANAPTPASVAAPRIVTRMPDGARFSPTNDDTIRGRAYDAAGTRTYLQQLDLEIRSTTEQAFQQHRDDPAKLNEVLDSLKTEQLREHVHDEIRADYELAFETTRGRLLGQAAKAAEAKIEEQNRAAHMERTAALGTDIARQLESYDPDIPETAASIHSAQTALDDHYDAAAAAGIIRPHEASLAKMASRRDTAVRFYGRQAEKLTPDGVRGLRMQLAEDFKAGRLDGVDAVGWDQLDTGLQALEQKKLAGAIGLMNDLDRRGTELADRVGAGFDVPLADHNRFVLDAGESHDVETVPALHAKIEAARFIRQHSPLEAQAYVAAMRTALGDNPTPAEIGAVAYAENRLAAMAKLVETDAMGYAAATGQIALQPIAMDDLPASLALRRDQATEVATRYGSPYSVLRPAERATLARALVQSPDAFPQFAVAVRDVFGDKAGAVLAEISEEAPVLAHAAGVGIATGDMSLATELAQAISAKQQGEYKAKMPGEDKMAAAASPYLGTALAFLGKTRAATMATAALIFERDANLFGFDPSKVGEAGSEANAAMARAVNRALGAQVLNGEQTGGVAEVNGAPIVAPTGMPASRPQRIMETLSAEDLAVLPPIRSANGVEITPRQLRGASLVTVGDGLYRVALGDPMGPDPQFLAGADGNFWTIDLNRIDRRRRDVGQDDDVWLPRKDR